MPTEIKFTIGGFEEDCHDVRAQEGMVKYEFRPAGSDRETVRIIATPSAKQWSYFWRRVEQIGVWDWQPKYWVFVMDGTQWELELNLTDRTLTSIGSNSYPGCEGRDYTLRCEFGRLLLALEQLIGQDVRIATRPRIMPILELRTGKAAQSTGLDFEI